MRGGGWIAVALLLGGCRISSEGLAPEPTALDDAGNPLLDSSTGEVGPGVDGGTDTSPTDSTPLFPVDDSGSVPECTGKADGTVCGAPTPRSICVAGECLPSRCGDGIVDPTREDCDDKNTDDGDSCPGDCKAKCKSNPDCNDSNECSVDTCDLTRHVCNAPAPVSGRPACTLMGGGVGVCNGTACTPADCGNGVKEGTEECDDKNTNDADGCKSDCTFTCEMDADCNDGDACNGVETCDTGKHTCKTGMTKSCGDGNNCTVDRCVAPAGTCTNTLVDFDLDTYAPTSLGSCGKDCHDGNPRVHPNQTDFFLTAYTKIGGGTSFDYDCDGKEEQRNTTLGKCVKSGADCVHTLGWAGSAPPACGGSDFIVESCEPGSCKTIVSTIKYGQDCH